MGNAKENPPEAVLLEIQVTFLRISLRGSLANLQGFPHHTDGGLYECALLLREEEESEEKSEKSTPSSFAPLLKGRRIPT